MKTQTEKLNVRDFVTIAILTVVELAVYFVIGMPLGSTPLSWIFCLGIQALPLGIVFMLMYTKVNKKGTVLISGLLLAALLLMSLWMVSLCVAAAAIIGEIIWEKCDRKKFSTMLICYSKPRSSSLELYYHHSALADFVGGPACYKVCPYIRDGFSGGICLSLDTK